MHLEVVSDHPGACPKMRAMAPGSPGRVTSTKGRMELVCDMTRTGSGSGRLGLPICLTPWPDLDSRTPLHDTPGPLNWVAAGWPARSGLWLRLAFSSGRGSGSKRQPQYVP